MEATKPVQQAFGSPGGKSYLAPRIAAIIPPHKSYVEPFAGGAAVFFRKEPSQKEVLSDKDTEIAFAFKFLRNMTQQQFTQLKKRNWVASTAQFNKVKAMNPKNDIDRFYQFLYLKRFSYGSGMETPHPIHCGNRARINIDRFWRVHERLQRTAVHNTDALSMIDRYDNPSAFFYLDPPYPKRSFVGQSFKDWAEEDLATLIAKLRHIKGKFALSLGTEHTNVLPKHWHITRVKVPRRVSLASDDFNQAYQYEIIATNYDTAKELKRPHIEMVPAKMRQAKIPGNGHKRVPVGVFTDKKGERLSRRYHRGWRRAHLS
jgi:DNA adenine methylase